MAEKTEKSLVGSRLKKQTEDGRDFPAIRRGHVERKMQPREQEASEKKKKNVAKKKPRLPRKKKKSVSAKRFVYRKKKDSGIEKASRRKKAKPH